MSSLRMDGRGYLRYFSIAVFVLAAANGARVGHDKDKSDPDWDFFVFVQQDPAGYCYFNDSKPPEPCYPPGAANLQPTSQNCSFPDNMTTLTLHGIWPTKNGTEEPNWCNDSSSAFDPSTIQDLIPSLVQEWTNVHPYEGFYNFWCHEWTKHGTCASGISSMSTEHGFFAQVLSLFKNYNYASVLDKHNITPSDTTTYKVDDFNAAFEDAYKVKPYLECQYDKEHCCLFDEGGTVYTNLTDCLNNFNWEMSEKKQVLIQISLCLTKNFSIFDCPSYIFKGYSACWTTEAVHYLPVVRSV